VGQASRLSPPAASETGLRAGRPCHVRTSSTGAATPWDRRPACLPRSSRNWPTGETPVPRHPRGIGVPPVSPAASETGLRARRPCHVMQHNPQASTTGHSAWDKPGLLQTSMLAFAHIRALGGRRHPNHCLTQGPRVMSRSSSAPKSSSTLRRYPAPRRSSISLPAKFTNSAGSSCRS
jgi:hypothetical protein